MKNDIFSTANQVLRDLPDMVHNFTWIILMVLYAHLAFGAWMERKKLKTHMRKYLIVRMGIMLFYLCVKAVDVKLGMFDLFLPGYLLFYFDGLIIVKGFVFQRCTDFKQAVKRLTKFSRYD